MTPGWILVTGASRGIGRAVVERLAGAGNKVLGIARGTPDEHYPASFRSCDLADRDATARVLADLVASHDFGVLVNNVGLNHPQPVEEVGLAHFDAILDLNLRVALQCAQALLPGMRRRRQGRIVNIASRAALGREGRSAYSAAKAGLIGMTRTWALELAAEGVTANVVAPGATDTGMFANTHPPGSPARERVLAAIPMRRIAEPDEVAAAVEFLATGNSTFITGQCLFVCGGASVGHAGM